MAIDTEAKRSSATHFLIPSYPQHLVTDGAISQADRQTLAWTYNGILATAFEAYGTEISVSVEMIESVSIDEIMIESVSISEEMIETGGSDEVM